MYELAISKLRQAIFVNYIRCIARNRDEIKL